MKALELRPYQERGVAEIRAAFAQAATAERLGTTAMVACIALGAVAGVTVTQALPGDSAEVDLVHLDAMARGYRSALLEVLTAVRGARETVAH